MYFVCLSAICFIFSLLSVVCVLSVYCAALCDAK